MLPPAGGIWKLQPGTWTVFFHSDCLTSQPKPVRIRHFCADSLTTLEGPEMWLRLDYFPAIQLFRKCGSGRWEECLNISHDLVPEWREKWKACVVVSQVQQSSTFHCRKTAKQQFSVLCDSLRFLCVDNSVSAEPNGLALEAKTMWVCSTQK